MKEICLPYTGIGDEDKVEVIVRNCTNNKEWQYRIESVILESKEVKEKGSKGRVEKLLNYIKNYDHCWELLNIFNTERPGGCIHLLYRKQNS